DQRVVPAPVEIEKRHGAKQSSLLAEGQDAGRVETEISREVGFRNVNPRNQPFGHFGKGRKLGTPRRLDADFEAFRKRVEIVLSRQSGSFLNPITHLSSLLPATSITGRDRRYAATIAQGCCGDAAPGRGSAGCVVG